MSKIIAWLLAGIMITPAIAGGDPNNWIFWKNVGNWRIDGIQNFGCRTGTLYSYKNEPDIVIAFSLNTEGTRLWIKSSKWETILPRDLDTPVAVNIWSDGAAWPAAIGYVYERGGLVITLNESGVEEFQAAERMSLGFAGQYTRDFPLISSRSAVVETARCALAMYGKDAES